MPCLVLFVHGLCHGDLWAAIEFRCSYGQIEEIAAHMTDSSRFRSSNLWVPAGFVPFRRPKKGKGQSNIAAWFEAGLRKPGSILRDTVATHSDEQRSHSHTKKRKTYEPFK